jgi:soluble lytic murein transglycosylase-like protein
MKTSSVGAAFAANHQTPSRHTLLLLILMAVLITLPAFAGNQQRPDNNLRSLIKTALDKPHHFVDRFEAEVWLVDMSGRLEKRAKHIPATERMDILRHVHNIAHDHGLNPQLVLSVMEVESNFDKYAISKAGARGLMQVMPFWRDEIGKPEDNLFDIETNIRYGCAILSIYLDKERKRLAPALARYNGSYGSGKYPSLVLNAFYNRWFVRQEGGTIKTASNQTLPAPTQAISATVKSK